MQGVEIHGTDRGYSGVRIKNANNIRVLEGRIYKVGDRGIHMTGRTTDCECAGNEIFNAGESGMEIDLALQTNEAKNGYSRIVNNHISVSYTHLINADVSVSGMNTRTGDICIVSGDVELENQGLCKMI